MDKRNNSASSSVESAEDAGEESHSSVSKTPELSPETSKPYSNPLRRSLVLLLDRERRLQSEESNDGGGAAEQQRVNALDAAQVLMPSDQLLDSRGRKPQLRLRPVASRDLDEYCNICQGSAASFLTPKQQQRRLSFPPQEQGPLPCRCHEVLASPAPSRAEARSNSLLWGLESFETASSSRSSNGAQLLKLQDKSLQLWMMDDDDSSEQDERRGSSAFRPVMLRPKKDLMNQSASDADLPSLESSVSTSPAEQQPPSQPPIAAMMARGVPLLPNTPEVSKPLLKSINLTFKGMTLQDK